VPAPPPPTHRPRGPLAAVAALVGLQAVGLVVLAVFYLVETAVARPASTVASLLTAALALAAGVGLALAARGLARARRWARSPALVTQLLVAPVALGLLQAGRWAVGAPLLAGAVVVAALLLSPPVSGALQD
jgi:hypothetical protein